MCVCQSNITIFRYKQLVGWACFENLLLVLIRYGRSQAMEPISTKLDIMDLYWNLFNHFDQEFGSKDSSIFGSEWMSLEYVDSSVWDMVEVLCLLHHDSSVGIATGWTARVRFQAVQDFSLHFLYTVQTDSAAHPGIPSPRVKRHERESDHLPPSSVEIKKVGAIPPHLHTSSRHSA
jgi:hypothetical protein